MVTKSIKCIKLRKNCCHTDYELIKCLNCLVDSFLDTYHINMDKLVSKVYYNNYRCKESKYTKDRMRLFDIDGLKKCDKSMGLTKRSKIIIKRSLDLHKERTENMISCSNDIYKSSRVKREVEQIDLCVNEILLESVDLEMASVEGCFKPNEKTLDELEKDLNECMLGINMVRSEYCEKCFMIDDDMLKELKVLYSGHERGVFKYDSAKYYRVENINSVLEVWTKKTCHSKYHNEVVNIIKDYMDHGHYKRLEEELRKFKTLKESLPSKISKANALKDEIIDVKKGDICLQVFTEYTKLLEDYTNKLNSKKFVYVNMKKYFNEKSVHIERVMARGAKIDRIKSRGCKSKYKNRYDDRSEDEEEFSGVNEDMFRGIYDADVLMRMIRDRIFRVKDEKKEEKEAAKKAPERSINSNSYYALKDFVERKECGDDASPLERGVLAYPTKNEYVRLDDSSILLEKISARLPCFKPIEGSQKNDLYLKIKKMCTYKERVRMHGLAIARVEKKVRKMSYYKHSNINAINRIITTDVPLFVVPQLVFPDSYHNMKRKKIELEIMCELSNDLTKNKKKKEEDLRRRESEKEERRKERIVDQVYLTEDEDLGIRYDSDI
jgi:hypothetical protein